MSNVVRPPFVHLRPAPEGERFVIIQPETMVARTFPPKPGERWPEAVRRFFESEPLLTESDLRTRLAEMGLDETAASQQIRPGAQADRVQRASPRGITSPPSVSATVKVRK